MTLLVQGIEVIPLDQEEDHLIGMSHSDHGVDLWTEADFRTEVDFLTEVEGRTEKAHSGQNSLRETGTRMVALTDRSQQDARMDMSVVKSTRQIRQSHLRWCI
jgi:hypothetical protein